jgi:hypothetical protein
MKRQSIVVGSAGENRRIRKLGIPAMGFTLSPALHTIKPFLQLAARILAKRRRPLSTAVGKVA